MLAAIGSCTADGYVVALWTGREDAVAIAQRRAHQNNHQ